MSAKPAVLITGASTGIGAVYADRFAKRGHDLVLVARDRARMEDLAARLRERDGVNVEIVRADLASHADLALLEARLAEDSRIGVLINNAGASLPGTFVEQGPEAVGGLIGLNVTAVARLASAVAPRFAREGKGAIVNVGSVIGLAPEFRSSVYGATKAFVLYFSQSLNLELGAKGVYVQAVVPGATRTEIWERSGKDVNALPAVMEVGDLVDAALVGYDRRETVTIPPLPDAQQWDDYEAARSAMFANFGQSKPAARYREAM
ncbi:MULTISPECIES: SDR family oxidoreductase [unclassified Paraburkholderia]|uniref:SDR family NAD(P)-dependent oxidoreductase n=1 Tax=unclassified Paraburkholderia TaxID=2615204 RepID=UPI002AB69797|nr:MULTISPECIES: SDR family oxidoreductase [unclassified Paraburkholderia]